jgi:molybdopterin biosynthesis enzyme
MTTEKNQQLQKRVTPSAPHSPIPFGEALGLWLDGVAMAATARVSPEEAVGRVISEALRAPADFPQTHFALRAGYAVDSAATIGASAYSPVIMMETPRAVAIGEPLPPDADAVLAEDAVAFEDPIAELLAEASPGENVRRAGEDLRAGDLLREAGEVFREADRMIALRIGIEACAVRVPRVRIVGEGGLLAAAVARFGGVVAADDQADAVIVVGEAADFTPLVAGLALRPGEEIALGRDAVGRPVLQVPDLPDCLLAAALVLVPQLMRQLSGAIHDVTTSISATLARRISSNIGMTEVVLLTRENDHATPIAVGDLPLSAIARADAWALVPPEAEGHAAGDVIAANALW